jgi:hypothetical protein
MDGLKPGQVSRARRRARCLACTHGARRCDLQRKILYTCLRKKLFKELKVATLSGFVSQMAAYHHGALAPRANTTHVRV